ncbi:zinc finger protein 26-like [Labrus bergylta]|uniref:zinc finger protein 26-like n=1 Tax=Labrus bergylta TaxID=56723 RepID=UPI0033131A36
MWIRRGAPPTNSPTGCDFNTGNEAAQSSEVQQLLVSKEEQQEWSPSLDQEDPEPPHIKEEQEEEQLQGLEEADTVKFPFTPVSVKSEDDEEEAQSSELHHRQTEQMETGADGEDCGGAEPETDSDPETDDMTEDSSDPETEDWKDADRKPFSCSLCGKRFEHQGNLNVHMRTHTGVKPFSCSICGQRFTQKAGLDYHLRTHTVEGSYSCSICAKTFNYKGALTCHMDTHTGVKLLSCSDCGKRFRCTSQLKIHKCVGKTSHLHTNPSNKHKTPLSCTECDATFPNNYLLVTHMRMHKGKKLFTCKVCGQKRQFSSHLEIHMRTHTGEKPYSCSVCDKRFSQSGIMRQHMAVHLVEKPYSCSDCGRRFFWKFQVKKHKCLGKYQRRTGSHCQDYKEPGQGRVLNPDTDLKADCDEETKPSVGTDDSVDIEFWKGTRKHHQGFTYQRNKRVSGKDGCSAGKKLSTCSHDIIQPKKHYTVNIDLCNQAKQLHSGLTYLKNPDVSLDSAERSSLGFFECLKSSKDRQTLLSHQTCDEGKQPNSCRKGFTTGGCLTRHISVQKRLGCIVCEKTFIQESQFINHVCVGESSEQNQSRTEGPIVADRSISCSHCGKGFVSQHNLLVHMKVHTEENLSFHMTRHTTEKPFCCSVCNTGFTDCESLVIHMRTHTGHTQFSCSVCGQEFAWRRLLTKHMEVHTPENICSGSVCHQRLSGTSELEKYECVGGPASELHPNRSEEKRETGTGADGEDCGGDSGPETEVKAEDSNNWKASGEHQSGLNSLRNDDVSQSSVTFDSDRKQDFSSDSDQSFDNNHLLKIHRHDHTGDKLFNGSGCENQLTQRGSLGQHMMDQRGVHRGVKQEHTEPPLIKEEQEEVWIGQADTAKFPFTPVSMKSEDDEEEAQSSQLHQRQTEQMETGADGEDCGGEEPERDSDSETPLGLKTEDKTEDSSGTEGSVDSDFWKETRERPSGLRHDEISASDSGFNSVKKTFSCLADNVSETLDAESDDRDFGREGNRKPESELNSEEIHTHRKPHSCSECGKRFHQILNLKNHMRFHERERFLCSVCGLKCLYVSHLRIHMRTHTGEKPFVCPVCGKKYAHKASMHTHMAVHTVEKKHICNICDRSFAWYTELKYHQCVGES